MEVRKWLKHPMQGVARGDPASVQALTRINAAQAPKRSMRRPPRPPFRGRLIRLGKRAKACEHIKKALATRETPWHSQRWPTGEQAGRRGVAARPGRSLKPDNAVRRIVTDATVCDWRGGGLSSKPTQDVVRDGFYRIFTFRPTIFTHILGFTE